MHKTAVLMLGLLVSLTYPAQGKNKPEQLEAFRDAGLGLFIHWGPVAKIGKEISWPVKDASEEFRDRYFSLYKTFNPKRFDPDRWAELAQDAGMRYVVFTAKHHAGFCMFGSDYTNYDIRSTPYARDICLQVAESFRSKGLKLGWYYSPADWHYQYANGFSGEYERGPAVKKYKIPYGRHHVPLLQYELAQIRELLTRYGPVDIMWYDGNGAGLRKTTWKIAPDVVIGRSALPTPEQSIPDTPPKGAWETCMTMGDQWAYKPEDDYKSTTKIVHNLIKIRAKGGNYLLNVGPKADGTLPEAQVKILKELAAWHSVNGPAIHQVRPWKVAREGAVRFVEARNESKVYAMLLQWPNEKRLKLKVFDGRAIKNVKMLGLEQSLDWEAGAEGLVITLPPKSRLPCDHAFTMAIEVTAKEP